MNTFGKTLLNVSLMTALSFSLTACLTATDSKIDYRSDIKGSPLEVPPGMSDYNKNTQYDLSGVVSAKTVGQHANTSANATPVALDAQDMHIERAGDTRWLVVKRPAEKVWPTIQTFWEDNGFTLRTNQPKLGIMETDWAENRANLPQTGLRKLIGKALDAVYDTGLRDMYRTRVEKVNGGVEIYISHRGMEEVYTSTSKDSTTWQPRAVDPELEVEMLRRLMIALGTNEADAKAALQTSTNVLKGASIQGNELLVNDTMENTWRRVGQVLDRAGLSVTDRDISQRVYYVTPNPDDRGMFKKSFGKLNETYQVRFTQVSANQVKVSFADKSGKAYADDGLNKVLKNLQANLK
ncbi:MAG: outer membrane protein assembly factor BamC [Burkholderiales bacterium]|jgi:outer membrane protein assembly factor BamC|nr:outer membrane protein assembly factor BamC [Burkholderiales bacterium]